MSRKTISNKIKTELIKEQNNKCANAPNKHSINLEGYDCLLWKYMDGCFDESGGEVDHIIEHCFEKYDGKDNLQVLCPNCHTVKTKRFMTQNKLTNMPRFNSVELHQGRMYMDISDEKPLSKKRKIKL